MDMTFSSWFAKAAANRRVGILVAYRTGIGAAQCIGLE